MSAPTLPQNTTAEPGYFSLPSTRWDILKFLIFPLVAIIWALITMWFAQNASAQKDTAQDTRLDQFQAAKETRISEIATIKSEIQAMSKRQDEFNDRQKEQGQDIKELLKRSAR